jgi:hypothetical protein
VDVISHYDVVASVQEFFAFLPAQARDFHFGINVHFTPAYCSGALSFAIRGKKI